MDSEPPIDESRILPGEIQRRAISGSIWTAINTVVSLPIAFAANAIVARSLGVSNYGHLAFLTAALGLTYAFANFGFSSALIQAGSRAEAGGRRSEADDLLRQNLGFNTFIELPILVAVALILTRNDPAWEAITLGSAMVLSCLLGGTALSITIENRTAASAKLAILINVVLQAASVSTAIATGSASAVWVVRMLIPAVALTLNFFLLDRKRGKTVLELRLPVKLGRAFWRYALFTWVSGMVGLLVYSRSEIFLLEFFHKAHALGLFALAFGLSQMITAPADAMLHALMPAIAGVLDSWPERSLRAYERGTRVSALLCGGVAAVVVPTLFFAIPLVYGGAFDSAAWLFIPLALLSALQSTNNPIAAFVNARQRGGLILRSVSAALVVDVVLAFALIPPFGAWGAVVANIAGQLVSSIWLTATEPLVVQRGIAGYVRLCRAFVLGTATGAAALGTGLALQQASTEFALAASCIVGAALYVIVVRLTRSGLTSQDHDALLDAIARPARPWFSQLLRPITTPSAV